MKAGMPGMARLTRLLIVLLLAWAGPARASAAGFSGLAFRPHPGAQLPLELRLADEHGRTVPLGQFFTGKPVILVLEYLHCKTLCGLALGSLAAALQALPLDAGRDFRGRGHQHRSARHAGRRRRSQSQISSRSIAIREPGPAGIS